MTETRRIVLTGLSGTGKSAVGRDVAGRLGWRLIDTDDAIVATFGTTIAEIFATHGEAEFRAVERRILATAVREDQVVIACGGGAVIAPDVWSVDLLRRPGTLVVTLDASPETSLHRLQRQQRAEGNAAARPLLAGDSLSRLTAMKAARQAAYDRSDVTLITDGVSTAELAGEISWLARASQAAAVPAVTLRATSAASAIHIAPNALRELGELTRTAYPRARRAWIITDAIVGPLHADTAVAALHTADFSVACHVVPAGEASKSLTEVSRAYDWLLAANVERGDLVVALGGGVVGDLAGFVAATVLRGVGLVQVPTSLLAMVDSSVGGKTGIDHPAGKNLIGAFYQPRLVVIDPAVLATLPARQRANGLAEVIKHAIIQPSTPGGERGDLLRFLERNAAHLTADPGAAMTYLIRRNIALKASVVEADERETGGRALLNFGHTFGHAIEAAGYSLLHGEAIAVGMVGESMLSAAVGLGSADLTGVIEATLAKVALPIRTTAHHDRVLQLLQSDKKRAAGNIRWVLPLRDGGATIRDDVPPDAVLAALARVSPTVPTTV